MTKPTPRNGYTIYDGPSKLDGKPIVVIATGFADGSDNRKTGTMIQTWILRKDVDPYKASHTGEDSSICGSCPHRGVVVPDDEGGTKNEGRSCYVKLWQAPLNVWRAYKRGIYPMMDPSDMMYLFLNRKVRLGAYGDPAAVPLEIIDHIGLVAEFTTGYTHQWRDVDSGYSAWLMASADNANDRAEANLRGYRTFRVRASNEELGKKEIVCPASKEAGHKTTCSDCKACGGTSAKAKVDIAIMAHGEPAKINNFYKRADEFGIAIAA